MKINFIREFLIYKIRKYLHYKNSLLREMLEMECLYGKRIEDTLIYQRYKFAIEITNLKIEICKVLLGEEYNENFKVK